MKRGTLYDAVKIGMVLLIIALLLAIFLPATISPPHGFHAEGMQAKVEVRALETALRCYQNDYNRFPQSGSCRLQSTGAGQTDKDLTDILIGINTNADTNPRGIVYLDMAEQSLGTNVVTAAGKPGVPGAFYDPWGNLYQMAVAREDENIVLNADGETLSNRTVAVWSWGPKNHAKPDPQDATHIRSWR